MKTNMPIEYSADGTFVNPLNVLITSPASIDK